MTECTTCRGQGLIGSGENPHNLQGAVVTCTDCGGTGKVADGFAPVSRTVPTEMITPEMRAAGVNEATPLTTREEMVEAIGEVEVEKAEASTVDNSTLPG
jgi:hypothetical protein